MAAMTTEPSPWRDNGPYETAGQVRKQFAAVTYGTDAVMTQHDQVLIVIREALMIAGVQPSMYEAEWLAAACADGQISIEHAQILAGWLIRAQAHLNNSQAPGPTPACH